MTLDHLRAKLAPSWRSPSGGSGSSQVDTTRPRLVTSAEGQSAISAADHYTFGPAVGSVSPNQGPVAGAQTVTISGIGFTGATSVTFGTTAAASFTVVSDKKITAKTPAHASAVVNVKVTTPGGTNAIVTGDRYTYQ